MAQHLYQHLGMATTSDYDKIRPWLYLDTDAWEVTFAKNSSLIRSGRIGHGLRLVVAHYDQRAPSPANTLRSGHPTHAVITLCSLSLYVTLVFPRKSAVGIPAIMSCVVDVFVLSLDPDHSEAVLWTLNALFFPVRNLHSLSYLCPIFLCSVPKTFERPPRVPTAAYYY